MNASVFVVVAGALVASAAGVSHAQVAEQIWPASSVNVDLGAAGNTLWSGWSLGGMAYGTGNNNQGGSGYVAHGYDFASNLVSITVRLDELRNTGGPFIATNTPFARVHGEVLFTPLVGMSYTLSGQVFMQLDGASTSNTTASGGVTLEVLSGPSLATYTGGVFRSGAGGFGAAGQIFNSSAPNSGSALGFLSAGTTYRLAWDFWISSNMNNDGTLAGDVGGPLHSNYLGIMFVVPGPGAGAALLGGAVIAARRRRR